MMYLVQGDEFGFQHNGLPAWFKTIYLYEYLKKKWVGLIGPTKYPARFSDLTPIDFVLWEYPKD